MGNRYSKLGLIVAGVFGLAAIFADVRFQLSPQTPFVTAFAIWTVLLYAMFGIFELTRRLLAAELSLVPAFEGRPILLDALVLAACLLVGAPMMGLMALSVDALSADREILQVLEASSPGGAFLGAWAGEIWAWLPALTIVWAALLATHRTWPSRVIETASSLPTAPAPAALTPDETPTNPEGMSCPLVERFPELRGKPLLALEADEHYVIVHTDEGSSQILYRMRDAIRDLGKVDGMQVHRSWWVSKDAVQDTMSVGRGLQLSLKSGLQIPVSQRRLASVKQWVAEMGDPMPNE